MSITKMIIAVLFLTSVFLVVRKNADAATYYVDFTAGKDTNTGTSTGTPFMHCPGDAAATGVAASVMLAGGDTVIFKGGTSYKGTININWSGSPGKYITYRGNTELGNWGIGKAQFDLSYTIYNAFIGRSKDYIRILNFDIYNGKNTNKGTMLISRNGVDNVLVTYTGSGLTTDYGYIQINDQCDYWEIRNCVIRQAENWQDGCSQNAEPDGDALTTYRVPSAQYGIKQISSEANPATHITIDNCELFGIESLITLYWADNVAITNNDFGGINRGSEKGYFSVALRIAKGVSNVLIRNNTYHDGWQYEGDDAGQRCHAGDWNHIYGDSANPSVAPHDITFEQNFLYNDKIFANGFGTSDGLYPSDGVYNLFIKNNIFANMHPGRTIYLTSGIPTGGTFGIDNVLIYNNNFISYAKDRSSSVHIYVGAGTGKNLEIKNNIFIMADSGDLAIDDKRAAWAGSSNNNLYYSPANQTFLRTGSTAKTLDQWKAVNQQDASSRIGNPNQQKFPASGSLVSSGDFRLTGASTQAIDGGASLFGLVDFDKDGNSRAKGTGFDIGAYESDYSVGSLKPKTPLIQFIQ
jgi:hypothetical protein